ncbi:MAG: sugar ABC transporter permease, partial [Pseudomonadota bacterium]
MSAATPPTGTGALAKREARLAWALLAPTVISVSLVVILPLLAIIWISFKPFTLSDLRPPAAVVRESLRGSDEDLRIEYRVRNSSQEIAIGEVTLRDVLPDGVTPTAEIAAPCVLDGQELFCDFGTLEGGQRERIRIPVTLDGDPDAFEDLVEGSEPAVTGSGPNVLTNLEFSFENFARVFDGSQFWNVMWVTLFYTVFGTIGALVMGLFAALLLNKSFKGQGIIRGLYLFPYVAPVIAVAFTWVTLFDPFSGSANALLVQMGLSREPINFFGERPLALIMVTVFEIWRYFPLSFLFILARMQSIDSSMYEAADMDGASPFQKFWLLSIP